GWPGAASIEGIRTLLELPPNRMAESAAKSYSYWIAYKRIHTQNLPLPHDAADCSFVLGRELPRIICKSSRASFWKSRPRDFSCLNVSLCALRVLVSP